MRHFDVLVIGGGIAGVSVAHELSGACRRVGLLDMESSLAYHTSGRSMATFLESYGGPAVRALTAGSRGYFEHPGAGSDEPLLTPLGMLWVGAEGEGHRIRELYEAVRSDVPDVRLVDDSEAIAISPALRPGHTELGMYEPNATGIDVHAFHQGYVTGMKRHGGEVFTSAAVVGARHRDGCWRLRDSAGTEYAAPVVVNAAGAWVDQVGALFGARGVGIEPRRRTGFIVRAPEGLGTDGTPLTASISTDWYFMPQGDALACSPADETLVEPCDARPDELELARAIDALNEATVLSIRSVRSSWAGLRNFVADHVPVAGFDPEVDGLFWLAGQGGYGMQIAPALSRVAAALIDGKGIPEDLATRGLAPTDLAADRPGLPE